MSEKKIGVLGSGQVGQVLARGFLKHGYQVMLGTGSPEKVAEWSEKEGKGVMVGTFAEAASFGELLLLAVKGVAAKDVLEKAGESSLKDKILIDATNPIADTPPDKGVLKFFTGLERSLMEDLQDAFPESRMVKAFNSVGNAHMVNPDFNGQKPSMFICGNDPEAKKVVSEILIKFGFEPEDMGNVESARVIEPLCILWCIPGFLQNKWSHAFKLLKK